MELQREIDPKRSWTRIDKPHNEFKTYQSCCQASYDNYCMSIFTFNELKSEYPKFPLPDEPQRYNKMLEVATLPFLAAIIKELLQPHYENLEVSCSFFPSTGTDIVVCSKGDLLLKMEVLNWWIQSVLTQQRALRIKDNLKGAHYKILYITSERNFSSSSKGIVPASLETLRGVNIYYSRYQILPVTYFDYLFNIDYRFTQERAILNEKTIKHQKIRLKRFFKQIKLLPLLKN